jgi:hypothetical protein
MEQKSSHHCSSLPHREICTTSEGWNWKHFAAHVTTVMLVESSFICLSIYLILPEKSQALEIIKL